MITKQDFNRKVELYNGSYAEQVEEVLDYVLKNELHNPIKERELHIYPFFVNDEIEVRSGNETNDIWEHTRNAENPTLWCEIALYILSRHGWSATIETDSSSHKYINVNMMDEPKFTGIKIYTTDGRMEFYK